MLDASLPPLWAATFKSMLEPHPVAPKRSTLYSHRLALHVGYLLFLRKQHAELRPKSTDFATYWG
eukprot:5426629-Alexandrium_andersonii.AAC.1